MSEVNHQALERLIEEAGAGDELAQGLLHALDTLALLASIDPGRRRDAVAAARDATAAALGLTLQKCGVCHGFGELIHGDHLRGPEYDWSEPCGNCDGYGHGFAEPDDPNGPCNLVSFDDLRGVVERKVERAAKREPATPEQEAALPF